MYTFLLILLILDALLLSAVVLMQAGSGGGLAALGGGPTEGLMGGRQAVTILTRLSWWTGGIFLALALILSAMAANGGNPGGSIQQRLRGGAPVAPAPTTAVPLPIQPESGAAAAPGAAAPSGTQSQPAQPAKPQQ